MRRKHNLESRLLECANNGILFEYSPTYGFTEDKIYEEKNYILPEISDGIELEIGCGKGGFVIQKALREPNKYFVAVESVGNVLVTACENAIKAGITNIKFIRTDAKYLPSLMRKGTVNTIYLNFSCPYPKKSQANRRLTADLFLKVYDYLLSENGNISLKTDKREFFAYSIEQFSSFGYVLKNISLSLHDDAVGVNNIVTEYEQRFTEQGLPIYYLEAYRGSKR